MILSHSSFLSLLSSPPISLNKTPLVKFNPPSNRSSSDDSQPRHGSSCSCGRRSLFIGSTVTSLLPISASNASSNYMDILRKVHPPRPDWYEEFFASVMNISMKSYEEEIAGYKSKLFANLRGNDLKVLEIGIGTGPNLRYYAAKNGIQVYGVDPNIKMEKYARTAAVAAGLPNANFKFIQAVGEALPLDNASVDSVVGTLVLCSVEDVNMTLKEVKRVLKPGGLYIFFEHVAAKEGTTLRLIQNILDPLQQTLADGCHLTRETGKLISEAGFSDLKLNMIFQSDDSLINPLIYGVACN